MARVERIRVYPVKALDGVEVEAASITPGGTLDGDRRYALRGSEGDPINGKRTPLVHELDADFDLETGVIRVDDGTEDRAFDLDSERAAAEAWFTGYFDVGATIEKDADLGFVDRRSAGPSVISTATLETVASWFADLSVESARRRLRANVEVSGVEPFWEDRFVGADAPTFEAGDVTFEGVEPCGRCVVPGRDPDTGEPLPEFRERFVERRRATFPEFADLDVFEHYFTLMLIASIPERDRGKTLGVGDDVTISRRERGPS